jgi:hypothetical protein
MSIIFENGNGANHKRKLSFLETWSGKSTRWIGSTQSLIGHTILFAAFIWLGFESHNWDEILLILTTIVSLEAIYLSIFIQMTINRNTRSLEEVEEGLDEIQENIDEIQEEVDEISDEEEVATHSDPQTQIALQKMEATLQKLMTDFQTLQKQKDL